MMENLEEMLERMRGEGFKLSHLSHSGQRYFAVVRKGFEPKVNLGTGMQWGDTARQAVDLAWAQAKEAKPITSTKVIPDNLLDLLK